MAARVPHIDCYAMLGLVCSGRAVQTEPVPVQPNKWLFEVPPQVQHFAIFFTQCPPPGYGAAIYHQSGATDWSLLGYLTAERPSAIYKLSAGFDHVTRVGIDIEPVAQFNMSLVASAASAPSRDTQAVTRVLESLYNFVMSFTGDPTNPAQAIPVKLFNDWYAGMMKRYSM